MAIKVEYDLIPWEDAPSTATPINAENLNARDRLLKKVVDKTNELSGQIGNQTGLSNDVKTALLNCFRNMAWTVPNGQAYYNALETALNSSVKPEQPEVGIVQTGSVLAITSGVTATQTGSVLAIA